MKLKWNIQNSLVGSFIVGIAAVLCCTGPLILLLLGISGAWISYLTILEPLRPVIVLLTGTFLGVAFWQLYVKPMKCTPGAVCAKPRYLLAQRLLFWLFTVILILLLTFPWYAHWLY